MRVLKHVSKERRNDWIVADAGCFRSTHNWYGTTKLE